MIAFVIRRDCRGKAGNQREHHMVKWRRYQAERASTEGSALTQLRREGLMAMALLPRPVVVTLTRVGKRLLDDDNLPPACAAVRDQIAIMLGVTDGPTDTRVFWRYAQRTDKNYAVEVQIVSADESRAA